MHHANKRGDISAPPFLLSSILLAEKIRPLLTATAADHSHVRHRQVTMLVRIILRLLFGFFLGVVHLFMVHGALYAHGMAHMVRQVGLIAFQFPCRAVIRLELVVVAVLLQAARRLTDLPLIIVAILLRGARETRCWQ